jgi:hypothetical protein
MGRIKIILIFAIIAIAVVAVWQVGTCTVENALLQGDMHDLSTQVGVAAAYNSPKTDDDFRAAVIKKAKERGIELQPNQVTVTRPEAGGQTPMYLAADYTVTVQLPRYSFVMRFTPSSTKQFF